MNCPSCQNSMILTRATNFGEQYWCCRICKDELKNLMKLEEPTDWVEYCPDAADTLKITKPRRLLPFPDILENECGKK